VGAAFEILAETSAGPPALQKAGLEWGVAAGAGSRALEAVLQHHGYFLAMKLREASSTSSVNTTGIVFARILTSSPSDQRFDVLEVELHPLAEMVTGSAPSPARDR